MSSERRGDLDFILALRRWQGQTESAGFRDRRLWLDDWREGIESLAYFEILRLQVTDSNDPMTEIIGKHSLWHRNAQLVVVDLEGIWNSLLSEGDTAMHSVSIVDDNIEFRFACRPKEAFVISGLVRAKSVR